ncbi:hypothetical protein BJY01DRAFT_93863 [Aspergillus pseudoustus]|uniref:Uncharacterized protein n=1 Tax=Aspergillus pseudoustus TaxID=1810923 RepID=A0ABR4IZH3_9EURO
MTATGRRALMPLRCVVCQWQPAGRCSSTVTVSELAAARYLPPASEEAHVIQCSLPDIPIILAHLCTTSLSGCSRSSSASYTMVHQSRFPKAKGPCLVHGAIFFPVQRQKVFWIDYCRPSEPGTRRAVPLQRVLGFTRLFTGDIELLESNLRAPGCDSAPTCMEWEFIYHFRF